MKDLHDFLKTEQLTNPATKTADFNSSSSDMQGFQSAELFCLVGLSGDTLSGSVKFKYNLEESSDNSTFTPVADADMIGGLADGLGGIALVDDAAEDETVYKVGYIGKKRYVRVNADFTGTHTNGTPMGILVTKGHAEIQPVV